MEIHELKASSIRVGDIFVLKNQIGNFNEGDEVEVIGIRRSKDPSEIQIILYNGKIKDTFYVDISDNFEDLI